MSKRLLGKYVLLKQLPVGPLGEVYVARRSDAPEGGPQRVIKLLNPFLFHGAEILPDWLDEIVALNESQSDPRLLRIDEADRSGEDSYFGMDFVKGDTLAGLEARLKRAGEPMPVDVALHIAAEAAGALHSAHVATGGVWHGNVTPRNVMLRFADGGVRVTDFGVGSLKLASGRTSMGTLRGKYAYLAPEQITDTSLGPRTDVFALGSVLHEALTGAPLFQRKTEFETVAAIQECDAPAPSSRAPALPRELDAVVLRALARDPGARYPDAASMERALREFIASRGAGDARAATGALVRNAYADYLATHPGALDA